MGERPVVLVVEDEPLVRMLAADVLEDAEMEVVEGATVPAAQSWSDVTMSCPIYGHGHAGWG
jgi:CheY-like chemotaxis protein